MAPLRTKPASATTKTKARPPKKARVDATKSIRRVKSGTEPPTKDKGKHKEQTNVPKKTSAPKSTVETAFPLPKSFKVVAGSYEKLLYGLEGTVTPASSPSTSTSAYEFVLKPVFIFPAHVSCIKAVAASPHGGKWLATGSSDEIIKVWDLRRRKEIGGLMHHEGSITQLYFPSRSHLLSTSEDGTMCLFRARDWAVLRSLKGHKGRVNSVAVHPSGKVALSVGKDRTMRMWDLMRGKGSASTKLGKEGEVVQWSHQGTLLAVQAGSTIDLYSTDMTLLHTITHPSRIHDLRFLIHPIDPTQEYLLVGAEDKKITIYAMPQIPPSSSLSSKDGTDSKEEPQKIPAPQIIAYMLGHTNRVKAIQTLKIALPPLNPALVPPSHSSSLSTTIVCTVSSDGKIHIYDTAQIPTSVSTEKTVTEITPVAEYDSKGTRLTCVTLADAELSSLGGLMGKKRKRGAGRDEEESDSDGDGGDGSSEGSSEGGSRAGEVVELESEHDWEDEREEENEDEE